MQQEVAFPYGMPHQVNNLEILVPAGLYYCFGAQDELHTLASNVPARIEAKKYRARFTGPRAGEPGHGNGHRLVGGNIYISDGGEGWIDIMDFTVFLLRWGDTFNGHNTPCGTSPYHADISGDGLVGAGDFTFIQANYLMGDEPTCCDTLRSADEMMSGPRTRISVDQLHHDGLAELTIADLNGDGLVDQHDMAAFFLGAQPTNEPMLKPAAISRVRSAHSQKISRRR